MEFELYFLEPIRDIGAIDATDKNFPAVCMVGRCIFGAIRRVKRRGFRADDCSAASVTTNFVADDGGRSLAYEKGGEFGRPTRISAVSVW